jgi:hypothetical protein
MNKLLSLFDYIHYRIYDFSKERGDNAPETNGTLILTLLQCFTILDLMVVVQIIHDYPFPNKFAFLPLLAILGVVNWYRYERNFDAQNVESKWHNEDKRRRVKKGWILGIYMLITFLTPPVYGYLKVNLKVI